MNITDHAVEQFQKRWRPDLHNYEARKELRKLLQDAAPIKEKTFNGDEMWKTPDGIRLVVKRDGDKSEPIVITVLPKEDGSLDLIEDQDEYILSLEDKVLDYKVKLGDEIEKVRVVNRSINFYKDKIKEIEDQIEVLKYK